MNSARRRMPAWRMQIHFNDVWRCVCKARLHGAVSPTRVSASSGMLLSVVVVMLLTVFYELFKVWRVWLETRTELAQPTRKYTSPPAVRSDSSSVLESSQSELSLTPGGPHLPALNIRNRSASLWNPKATGLETCPDPDELKIFISLLSFSWVLRVSQTFLHVLQVSLGYMLMLCVMSYNAWIFLAVVVGSALGYFISFPLLNRSWWCQHFQTVIGGFCHSFLPTGQWVILYVLNVEA